MKPRVIAGAVVGTALEAYDLYLYGTAAALVFGPLFFAGVDASAATLLSFAAFAVAFIARPLGALLFGRLGDRRGRTRTLSVTLILMGVGTAAIGALPDYSQIGIAAPVLLTGLRFVQGLAFGGEFTGGVLLLAENAPPGRRGFYAGLNGGAPAIGFVLSSGLFLGLRDQLGPHAFDTWGWRIPFLLSLALLVIGVVVRRTIAETPEFAAARAAAPPAEQSERLRSGRTVALAAGANVAHFVFFYLVATFSLSYGATTLDLPSSDLLGALTIAFSTNLITVPLAAALSDRVGRRPVIAGGLTAMAVWIWPFFALLGSGSFGWMLAAYLGAMVSFALVYGPLAAFTIDAFPTVGRYRKAALSYHIAGVVGSALGPVFASWLVLATGSWIGVAGYVAAAAIASLVCTALLPETRAGIRSAHQLQSKNG